MLIEVFRKIPNTIEINSKFKAARKGFIPYDAPLYLMYGVNGVAAITEEFTLSNYVKKVTMIFLI